MRRPHPEMICIALAALLTACSPQEPNSEGALARRAETLMPDDSNLAALYSRSCRSCHILSSTGAPLTGDTKAWAPRLELGMDVLVDRVVNGYQGMPPFGLCMDCSAEDFEALTRFMATGSEAD